MTRLHQAASAVKHKVQGTITHCFSHKQLVDGDDENLEPRESDDSEPSLGPSLSSVTEYYDAEPDGYGTGSEYLDDEDSLPRHHPRENGGVHSDAELPGTTEKQQSLQKQQQQHNHPQHHHLHHKGPLPGVLVPVDADKVTAMRAILAEDTSVDPTKMEDTILMRFLIARNMDVHKAAEMFTQHCKWREEFVPRGYMLESEVANQLAAGKTFIQGLDRHGRPLMIVQGCKHFAKDRDMEEFKRYSVYCMDKTMASMPEGVDKFCCIFDLESTGLKNFDTAALLVILDFFQAHYPERLGKIYMIHVPYIFWGVWKIASKALLPRTRAKITFLTDEETKRVLRQEFGEDCLPTKYGGLADFQLAQDYHVGLPVHVFC